MMEISNWEVIMMRKLLAMLLVMVLLVSCTGCSFLFQALDREPTVTTPSRSPDDEVPPSPKPTAPTEPVITQPSEPLPTEPAPTEPVPTEPEPTEPEHSPLYIPGLEVEDVIRYFNEVCLDAEFVNSGDASVVQKWATPIYYILDGYYTEQDLTVLRGFAEWLNTVEGFPGIYETQDWNAAGLRIYFTNAQGMIDIMGSNFVGMDGAVTFWYRWDEIFSARICIRTDIHQQVRNSVILEELYNGLGPIQDTSLRTDSIIFSGYSAPQALTEVDELILRLLYHPDMICGMNAEQCAEVIRQLYY